MRGGKLDPWWQWLRTAASELLLLEGELGQRGVPPLHILKIMHFHTYPTLYFIHEQNCTEFPVEESSKLVMGHAW